MNEKFEQVIKHPASIPAAVGVVAFSAGLGVGYFLWNRKKGELHVLPADMGLDSLESVVDDIPTPVIIDKEDYEAIASEAMGEEVELEVRLDPESVVEAIEEELSEEDRALAIQETFADEDEEVQLIEQNIFAVDDGWDYEEELKSRSENAPYVIHRDEFYENEHSYSQLSLTYYSGDNILADDDNKPVYNMAQVIGELKFGHGSGDTGIFYARNDKLRAEYEVVLYDGHYALEVMGLDQESDQESELRHSKDQRFRPDD